MFPSRDDTHEPASLISIRPKLEVGDKRENDINYKTNFQEMNENVPLKPNENIHGRRWLIGGQLGFTLITLTLFIVSVAMTIVLIVEIYSTEEMTFPATVVSDNEECSQFGVDILKSGGTAVDAAVAAYFCLSVVHPHVAGIGGGGFMLVRDYSDVQKTVCFDFRETVPFSASHSIDSSKSILSVGVPGLLHGLYTAQKQFGKVSWSSLTNRAASLARDGFEISPYLAQALALETVSSPSVWSMFPNLTRDTDLIGKRVKRENFAKTLDLVAQYGADVFYHGMLGQTFIEEIHGKGGFLTKEDLQNYSTIVSEPLMTTLRTFTIESAPPPSSGITLLSALKHFRGVNFDLNNFEPLVKADEFASDLSRRLLTFSSNEDFYNNTETVDFNWFMTRLNETILGFDDTSSVRNVAGSSVVATDGEYYVSLISGLGSWFGSQIVTSDGIVLNDAIRDLPPYPSEDPFLKKVSFAGQRPLSPFSPVIMYEKNNPCGVRLISSSSNSQLMLQVLFQYLMQNNSVENAVEAPRFLFSWRDNSLLTEKGDRMSTNTSGVVGLNITTIEPPYISINIIAEVNDDTFAQADSRGGGEVGQT